MTSGIYSEIKKRIELSDDGSIFVTSDFTDIAKNSTVRKCLSRQVEDKMIRRILDGVYEKPIHSNESNEYVSTNPDKVASAIAKNFHWTIAPCGKNALNKLGISTDNSSDWTYASDGPYREFSWGDITISFRHRANRDISQMSETTILVVEALKEIGKENVDNQIILTIKNQLDENEKNKLYIEARNVSEWIKMEIKKVCDDNHD